MRLKNGALSFVVNFLLGVSWGLVIIGMVSPLFSFYEYGLLDALILSVVGAIPGLVAILFLEHFITTQEKYLELQKQTELLEVLKAQKEP
ncbi:MAG TPA: hypothetical protein ENK72_01525 [Epsilonproteobacteria bacterium]|nr:hypothetical protein [Campylobacterota bacterium]